MVLLKFEIDKYYLLFQFLNSYNNRLFNDKNGKDLNDKLEKYNSFLYNKIMKRSKTNHIFTKIFTKEKIKELVDRKILNRYLDYAYRQKEYKLYRKSVKKNIFRYNLLQEYIWNGKGDKVNSLRK